MDILPKFLIDTFYNKIVKCKTKNFNYDVYIRSLIKLNGNIPEKIKEILN